MCTVDVRTIREKGKRKYRNVVGFINLTLGYFLASVCPISEYAALCNLLFVAIFVFVILGIEELLVRVIARCLLRNDEQIPYVVLKDYGADTAITGEEIDAICK